MRFSVWPNPQQHWTGILELARWADERGWEGVWIADHFMPNPPLGEETEPTHEAWGVLGGLAAATERVRLGTLVCGNTYRHPAVLLKHAITVDQVSAGRVVLGIGAGWQENEHRAYGIPFFTVSERLDRLDEACQLIRHLLASDERSSFSGRHYSLTDAPLAPRPTGPFPLLVGGGGERVTMRIAAQYADEWNVWGTPEVMRAKGTVLERHCEAVGRDPAEIRRSSQALLFMSEDEEFLSRFRGVDLGLPTIVGTPPEVVEVVASYADAGVDELILPDWNLGARRLELLDRFHEEVVSHAD